MYKRLLTIQDISCVGQCSLTVALPVISACGVETAVLPSAILSTHTGCGFSGYTFRDLTEDFPAISAHWKKEHLGFDCFYTGYLGSVRQIELVRSIVKNNGNENALFIVDPVMGDNGKFYPSFDNTFVLAMKKLVSVSDIVLPNITEAALLSGLEYKEEYDETYIRALLLGISKIGAKTVILTGVSYNADTTGIAIWNKGKYDYYAHKKIRKLCHGTGDLFASAFSGAIMRGIDCFNAVKIAADFTLASIEYTLGDDSHFYGVKFERALCGLFNAIENAL